MATLDCIKKIWPDITDDGLSQERYSAFLQYLDAASDVFAQPNTQYVTPDLHATLDLIAHMRQAPANNNRQNAAATNPTLGQMTRQALVANLAQNPGPGWRSPPNTSQTYVLNSMCLALSIWLTLNIVPPRVSGLGMLGTRRLEWQETSTIADVIGTAFPHQPNRQPDVPTRINPSLTIEYLHNYHHFRVLFTDNLAEHLDIQRRHHNDPKPLIKIYRHKIFLWNELRFTQTSPLPRDLVQEMMDTLNLLFPYGDQHTEQFLSERNMDDFYGLGMCGGTWHCDLSRYRYWRNRIAELSAIVETGPTGFNQVMPGRNFSNIKESVTFWLTVVLITILTVASIVLGALSYQVGRRQLDLAEVQYNLSLAQACATMNSTQLPGWCP